MGWLKHVHELGPPRLVLNSIISGCGQSRIQINEREYFYAIHNIVFGNATSTPGGCGVQDSGIFFANEKAVPGYTSTPDDLNNPILGDIGSSFHNAIEWNVLYDNEVTTNCSPNRDGNNIIMDTWSWSGTSVAIPYLGGGPVAFNIAYNGGGRRHSLNKLAISHNSQQQLLQQLSGPVQQWD